MHPEKRFWASLRAPDERFISIGLLVGLAGALAVGAGTLAARRPELRVGAWGVYLAWALGTLVAARAAARHVARGWHGPLAAAAALSGLGLLMQTRLHPLLGVHQAGVWLLSAVLAAGLWHWRGGPWARGRGWEILLALAALGVLLTLRWGVHPAGLPGRLWLPLGPWLFPPGEVLKAAWVGVAARQAQVGRGLPLKAWALALALTGLLVLQGDWGSGLLVLLVALSVHAGQADRWRVWLVAAGVAALLLPALLQVPRVQQRWNAWLWPHHAPLGYGYQPLAAARALERGGWWGQGLAAGQPEQVPLSATDFIFVAWGEEGGWGMLALLVALEALVWLGLGRQTCRLAAAWPQSLGMAVTAYGAHLTAWVMAGNLRLVPLSGLPLPWVAHGGAALLTLSALVAVLTAQPLAEPSTSCPRVWRGHLYAWGALYALVLARAALLAG